jgi:hypothetical protein
LRQRDERSSFFYESAFFDQSPSFGAPIGKFAGIEPERFLDQRLQISATRELNRRVEVLPEEEACVHAKQSAQNACTMMRLQGTANSLSLSLSLSPSLCLSLPHFAFPHLPLWFFHFLFLFFSLLISQIQIIIERDHKELKEITEKYRLMYSPL